MFLQETKDDSDTNTVQAALVKIKIWSSVFGLERLSGHPKTGQRRSGQNRPTGEAGTKFFYPVASCGGKSIFVRQLRGPHLST